jgi:PhnB protein
MHINPYLNFNGNTEEAFNFYKSVFGGEFVMLQRFKDAPDGDKLPEGTQNKVMHVSLPIGKNNILMGTDACESMGFKLAFGNNTYLCLGPDSREETERVFNALAEGGEVEAPLNDTFWGAYYGSVKDKYGVHWMLNFQEEYLLYGDDTNRSLQN